MRLSSILLAVASVASVNAATLTITSPTPGQVIRAGAGATITWMFQEAGGNNNVPNGLPADMITFVLEDLRNGENTGVPLGDVVARAPLSAQSVSGAIPVVPSGTNYTIRAEVKGAFVFSRQFTIDNPAMPAPSTTAGAPTASGTGSGSATRPSSTSGSSASPSSTAGTQSNGVAPGQVASWLMPLTGLLVAAMGQ
ncbi:hypothetical protein HK104_008103 [Borealophlyctis nickersoniae]|nr:hypothetical protein HK104_008103 [Borealophlyctis nickersoniae]